MSKIRKTEVKEESCRELVEALRKVDSAFMVHDTLVVTGEVPRVNRDWTWN